MIKNKLLNELNDIAPIYIDEHLEWSKRKKVARTMMYKTVSVAACLVLVITSVFALMPGGFLRGNDHGIVPQESSTTDTQIGDHTPPQIDPPTVIYAENLELGAVGNEVVVFPPELGSVRFAGNLYELMYDDETYEDCVFAVSVSFYMEFKESEEYHTLIAESKKVYESMWDRYNNEFLPHKLKVHNTDAMDWNCEDCLHYHSLHEQDEKRVDDLNREALEASEREREEHEIKLREYGNSLMESLGLDYRFVTVNWINAEPVITQEFRILHLTKEQLLNFKVTDEIGAEFVLLPEWADCGEDVINRDYNSYPVQIE